MGFDALSIYLSRRVRHERQWRTVEVPVILLRCEVLVAERPRTSHPSSGFWMRPSPCARRVVARKGRKALLNGFPFREGGFRATGPQRSGNAARGREGHPLISPNYLRR